MLPSNTSVSAQQIRKASNHEVIHAVQGRKPGKQQRLASLMQDNSAHIQEQEDQERTDNIHRQNGGWNNQLVGSGLSTSSEPPMQDARRSLDLEEEGFKVSIHILTWGIYFKILASTVAFVCVIAYRGI